MGQFNGNLNLVIDVHYARDDSAMVAGIAFSDWTSAEIVREELVRFGEVRAYRPGYFYERELPCVLALLQQFGKPPATVIIDGYVTLGADQRDGFGAHLYHAFGGRVPVIGVAKRRFSETPAYTEVFRGASIRPLYVTCRGIAHDDAKRLILSMRGNNRMPTLLNAVDRACREAALEHRAPRETGAS